MSRAAKLTFLSSMCVTTGIVYWVLDKQKSDIAKLRHGVVKDLERQAMKKQMNVAAFQEQEELTRFLKRERTKELEKLRESRLEDPEEN